jgi:voltage-gated potassium channel
MSRDKLARALDIVLLILTLGFGLLFALSEVFLRGVDQPALQHVDLGFTVAFLLVLLLQLAVARDRLAWLRANWFDVLVVVVVAFPLLRALRFYRYVPRTFGLLRLAAILTEAIRAHLRSFGRGNIYNILVAGLVVIFVGAVLVRFSEEGVSEANINSLGAMWWAVTTVTTVGYGDKYPTTTGGRVVASGLMFLGIGLFGILTASISSVFVAQSRESELAALHEEIAGLRREIAGLARALAGDQEGATGRRPG